MEHENIILSVRPYALSLFNPIVSLLAVLGVLFGARWYFNFNFFGYFSQVLAVSVLASLFYFLNKYWVWHKTVLYVTEKRLVFRHQLGIFSHNTIELLHKDIVEVSYAQFGFDDTFSKTGVLNIKTTSQEVISIPKVKDPQNVVRQINELRQSGVCQTQ